MVICEYGEVVRDGDQGVGAGRAGFPRGMTRFARCRGLPCRFSPPAVPPTSARVCFRPRFGRPAVRPPSCRSDPPRSTRLVGSSSRAGHPVPGASSLRAPAPVPCRRGGSTQPAFPSTPPRAPGTVPLAVCSHPDCRPCLLYASSLPLPPPLTPPVYRKHSETSETVSGSPSAVQSGELQILLDLLGLAPCGKTFEIP